MPHPWDKVKICSISIFEKTFFMLFMKFCSLLYYGQNRFISNSPRFFRVLIILRSANQKAGRDSGYTSLTPSACNENTNLC